MVKTSLLNSDRNGTFQDKHVNPVQLPFLVAAETLRDPVTRVHSCLNRNLVGRITLYAWCGRLFAVFYFHVRYPKFSTNF